MNALSVEQLDLPYIEDFWHSVTDNNVFVGARCLLVYQRDILLGRGLSLISPFSGNRVFANSCLLLKGGSIAYHFAGLNPFWVVAGDLKFGYPLTHGIFSTDSGMTVYPATRQAGASQEIAALSEYRALGDGMESTSDRQDGRPAIVIGHQNFAHHLWNELGGLQEWLSLQDATDDTPIYALFEPLGDLESLFPQIKSSQIVRTGAKAAGAHSGLLTRVGATKIPLSLRARVVQQIDKNARVPSDIRAQVERGSPVFWLTVRPPGVERVCQNEIQFLHRLGAELLTRYPDSVLVFDGFSFPNDFDESTHYAKLRHYMFARRDACDKTIEEITSLIKGELGDLLSNRIVSVSGWRLDQALALAAEADFYVSHAGTIQHKLGWIHNTAGFIHSCKDSIRPAAQRWYADQVEQGVLPRVISEAYISDVEMQGLKKVVLRNHDYVIQNIPQAVSSVIESFASMGGISR